MCNYHLGLYEKAMPSRLPLSEKLICAKQAGFDFLELSIDETEERLQRLDWSAETRKSLADEIAAQNMPVLTMCLSAQRRYPLGSHDEKTRLESLDILRKAILLARDLGIRLIQLAGYDVYYEQSDDATRRYFGEGLRASVAVAAKHGVILGFETMEIPFMDTVSKAMRYVRSIASPYLGVYPDLGNLTNACYLYGDMPALQLEDGRGHIWAMHLKETAEGKYRDMRFGEGRVDFTGGTTKALELGVNLFVAECWDDGRPDWQEGLAAVNRFLRGRIPVMIDT